MPAASYQLALIHLALDDLDAAFDSLERACAERGIGVVWLPVDPIWDRLRTDPRFRRLVSSMGLKRVPAGRVPAAP